MYLLNRAVLVPGLFGQDLTFDSGGWQTEVITQQREWVLLKSNEARVDTVYSENIETGELDMIVTAIPLSRYEYFNDGSAYPYGRLHRRIAIRQEVRTDSTYFERPDGSMGFVTQLVVKDIPDGDYFEFHPNGTIHYQGRVSGLDGAGNAIKVGEWIRYDENGKELGRWTYP